MVKHTQLFIDSLIHPKKLAAYRILSIGKVIQYVFILITFVTIFSFIQFLMGVSKNSYNLEGLTEYMQSIQWLLYPFSLILIVLMTTILVFIRISIYAVIGLLFIKVSKRRGEYRHLWRTASFAITWSILLTILFSIIPISNTLATLIGIIITLFILLIATSNYPKLQKK